MTTEDVGPGALQYELVDGVATLTIDRPAKLGALSSELIGALEGRVRELRYDQDVRAVVITGIGRGFIAGADIQEYVDAAPERFTEYQERSRRTFDAIAALPCPVIAGVNGYALGGGFELALCCDIVIAAQTSRFGLPEVKLGLVPGGGATQRLTRAVGTRRAKELIMSGRIIRPAEAREVGVVHRIVEDDELPSACRELAASLAAGPTEAIAEAKRMIDIADDVPLAIGLGLEQEALIRLFRSEDGVEGVRAFLEKRDPVFRRARVREES